MSYPESIPSRASDAGPDSYSVLDRDEDGYPCPGEPDGDELVECGECGEWAALDRMTEFPRLGLERVCPACENACEARDWKEMSVATRNAVRREMREEYEGEVA